LIAAAVIFFGLGLASVLIERRPATPTPRSTPVRSTSTVSLDVPQVSVLILGVDTLDHDSGELQAVWLASFRPPGKELFLFGFPTDRRLPDGHTLREAYAAADDPGPALTPITKLPVDAVVVLDAQGFAELIDFLGGVPSGQTTVDGAAALNVLALLHDDPAAALLAQTRLLQALAQRAGAVQPGTDLQPLLDLAPSHAVVSMPAREALTLVAPYLPFESQRIHISLPSTPDASGG
jgi:hypothetical protein